MNKLKSCVLLLVLMIFLLGTNSIFADNGPQKMVLVSSSAIPAFTPRELRRFYLGASVTKQGNLLTPIRNKSDNLLYEVFLQKVISMSDNRYERFLIKRVYRGAGSSPRSIKTAAKLNKFLLLRSNAVSFMWEADAKKISGIKIIQPLW